MENALHITVGTSPSSKFDLTYELTLLKAALLYADRVKLCSISSSTLVLLSFVETLDDDSILELIAQTAGSLTNNPEDIATAIKIYKFLRQKKRRNKNELINFRKLKSQLDKAKKDLRRAAEKIMTDAHADGLASALNSGIVELKWFDLSSKTVIEDFLSTISEAILSGKTYPLLDDPTSSWVNAAIREGKLLPLNAAISRAKQVGVSSDLFCRLPLFEKASVDEIVDIRKELDKSLIRFRSAIISFSREIENAPWEKGFSQEVDQVFNERVLPSILEIEEAYKSSNVLLNFVNKLTDKPFVLPSSSALGLLISKANQLPDLVTQSISIAAGGAVILLETLMEWKEKKREIEKNQLYFFYRVEKHLSS